MAKLPDEFVRRIREQIKLEAKLSPRGYGSKKVEDTLEEIRVALQGVGGDAVHGNDEEPGLLPLLERSVEECDEAIEGEGPSAKYGLLVSPSSSGLRSILANMLRAEASTSKLCNAESLRAAWEAKRAAVRWQRNGKPWRARYGRRNEGAFPIRTSRL